MAILLSARPTSSLVLGLFHLLSYTADRYSHLAKLVMAIRAPFNPDLPISIVVFEGEATFVAQAECYQDGWEFWEKAVWMQCAFDPQARTAQDLVFSAPAHPATEIVVEQVSPDVVDLLRAKRAFWLWVDPHGTPLLSLAVHID